MSLIQCTTVEQFFNAMDELHKRGLIFYANYNHLSIKIETHRKIEK